MFFIENYTCDFDIYQNSQKYIVQNKKSRMIEQC